MKKTITILITIILVAFAITGCGKEKKPQYSVLLEENNAPYSQQGKEETGFIVDILKAVAEQGDFQVNLVFDMQGEYSACINTLTDGSDSYDYTDHFYQQGIIFANSIESDITTYEQLLHKTIGVMENSYGQDFASQIAPQYNLTVKTYTDVEKLFKDAEEGKLDGMFEDELVVKEQIAKGAKLKTFPNSEKTNILSFAVNKGENKEFINSFNEGYRKIVENGTYDKILKKYTNS